MQFTNKIFFKAAMVIYLYVIHVDVCLPYMESMWLNQYSGSKYGKAFV